MLRVAATTALRSLRREFMRRISSTVIGRWLRGAYLSRSCVTFNESMKFIQNKSQITIKKM